MQLAGGHDIAVLAETRETSERRAFLKSTLPVGISSYTSGIDQYKGGVAMLVKQSFIEKFSGEPTWKVIVKGRIARLEFKGPQGCLHVYGCYLNPDSPAKRSQQLKAMSDAMDDRVHNVVVGDFNFVVSGSDRISKTDARAETIRADKQNAGTWVEVSGAHALKEFSQKEYTCENSFGWSRTDRAYTNLHVADIYTMRTTCSVLCHPRHLSDHKPISVDAALRIRRKTRNHVPRWVTAHASFREELEAEFGVRCGDFLRMEKREPTPFEKLQILKDSTYATSAFIRRECAKAMATTTEHRMAVHMAFIKSIHACNFKAAKELQ